jgi:hypothetical protein
MSVAGVMPVIVVSMSGRRGVAVVIISVAGVVAMACVMPVVVVSMRVRRSVSVVVVAMGGRRGMAVVVMSLGGGRSVPVVVVTVTVIVGTIARAMTVIVVRLMLVAHCYSVPQPLFAVFAAKSV